jgi:hypothetical protein
VAVPFAWAMAEGCDPTAVRLRRDFPAVLTLIKAHAILHAHHREKDAQGRVVAILEDYTAVYDVVADLVSYGTGQSAPETVRETLEAVNHLMAGNSEGVSYTAIGKELGIDESAARRRVMTAINRRYLENRESKPRCAAKIVLGESLPDGKGTLPHPKSLFNNTPELSADLPTQEDSFENRECYGRQPGKPTDCQLPNKTTTDLESKEPNSGQAVGKGLAEPLASHNYLESQNNQSNLAGWQEKREGSEYEQPLFDEEIIRI